MDLRVANNSTDCPYWIMTSAKRYDILNDSRFLIPFMTKCHKNGMMNHLGKVVVKPEYDIICNDIHCESDLLVVGKLYPYGFKTNNNDVDSRVRYHYGVIKSNGEILLEIEYRLVILGINCNRITVESENQNFFVLDKYGEIIVPVKKYKKIDGFDNNLARVIGFNDKWGIINEKGEEVLPVEYSEIWNFYGKNKISTKTIKNGIESEMSLCELNSKH